MYKMKTALTMNQLSRLLINCLSIHWSLKALFIDQAGMV